MLFDSAIGEYALDFTTFEHIIKRILSEETLRKEAIERTDLSHLKGTPRLATADTSTGSMYQVESTGAVVSLNSAVGLIHFYCSQLPSDRF